MFKREESRPATGLSPVKIDLGFLNKLQAGILGWVTSFDDETFECTSCTWQYYMSVVCT